MNPPKTLRQLFDDLQMVEGKRLAFLAAIEFIERDLIAVDVGSPTKVLKSEHLFGSVVREDVLFEAVADLHAFAVELEHERDRMEQERFDVVTTRAGQHASACRQRSRAKPAAAATGVLKTVVNQ